MCDYSLTHVKSRPAKVDDKLTVKNFNMGTRGFSASEDFGVAVCVLPGTELAFEGGIIQKQPWWQDVVPLSSQVAIFRQVHKDQPMRHHDALELPDGTIVMLNELAEGQTATVLQMPAAPKTEAEAKEQTRLEVVA